jgi:hypothetical protein
MSEATNALSAFSGAALTPMGGVGICICRAYIGVSCRAEHDRGCLSTPRAIKYNQ